MAAIELKVPDIGDFKDVEIIEVLVKAGDEIVVYSQKPMTTGARVQVVDAIVKPVGLSGASQ